MEEIIKKNIFVLTRDLVKDYYWVCKPTDFNEKLLLEKFEDAKYCCLSKMGIFTSKWYKTQLEGNNNQIVFRIVVDGRKDQHSRLIERYEGSSFSDITPQNISILENCLREIQEKTNNYGYGYRDFLQTEKKVACERKKVENCTVEIEDGKIVIKSNILAQFLKGHTYEDLLAHLQIDSNNIDRKDR